MKLDDLIALNDEIHALVRSGVPLDDGLATVAGEWPATMRRHLNTISARLREGQDLAQALADPSLAIPPVYLAVIRAGLRAGRLEVALEGIANSARRQVLMRREATTALIYPVLLLFLSYGVLVLLVTYVLPVLLAAHESLLHQSVPSLKWFESLRASARSWAPWPPLAAAAILVSWWIRAGHVVDTRHSRFIFRVSPARVRRLSVLATFTEVLSLLVEHAVPMPEAVVLAADASGSRHLGESARVLADQIQSGDVWPQTPSAEFPDWLVWLIGSPSPRLAMHLRLLAQQYRNESVQLNLWLSRFAPIAASSLVGGLAVLAYALLLFVPFTQLLGNLGRS